MNPASVRKLVEPKTIPDGTYYGIWSGYMVTFTAFDCDKYELTLAEGIRGQTGCRIHCLAGEITVERLK